jgi:hypothetical protein
LGFIGYWREREGASEDVVRIYLECAEGQTTGIACSFAVEVAFPAGGAPCRLRGVDSVLALKKFYKLVFSLEERAREHGNDWRSVMESPERLLEHLRYTRNARDFTGLAEPAISGSSEALEDPDCMKIGEGS